MKIDHTWYCKPCGIRERLTAGGVVVRRTPAGLMVALAREIHIDGWVLPKGGVEPGEDIDAAALREIEEEAGLTALAKRGGLEVMERLESERRFWSIIHYALYETDQVQGVIRDLEHHPGMDWFPLDDLPDMFWPDERAMIERHREAIHAELEKQQDAGAERMAGTRAANTPRRMLKYGIVMLLAPVFFEITGIFIIRFQRLLPDEYIYVELFFTIAGTFCVGFDSLLNRRLRFLLLLPAFYALIFFSHVVQMHWTFAS